MTRVEEETTVNQDISGTKNYLTRVECCESRESITKIRLKNVIFSSISARLRTGVIEPNETTVTIDS